VVPHDSSRVAGLAGTGGRQYGGFRSNCRTLKHFTSCVAVFWLGACVLARITRLAPFWIGTVGGLLWCCDGVETASGGLEEPVSSSLACQTGEAIHRSWWRRLCSDRVYGTLFYRTALAGVISFDAAVSVAVPLASGRPIQSAYSRLGVCSDAHHGLRRLYWSGPKAAAHRPGTGIDRLDALQTRIKLKAAVIGAVLLLGFGAFWAPLSGCTSPRGYAFPQIRLLDSRLAQPGPHPCSAPVLRLSGRFTKL